MTCRFDRHSSVLWGLITAFTLSLIFLLICDAAIFAEMQEVKAIVFEKQYRPDQNKWVIIAVIDDQPYVLDVPFLTYQGIEEGQVITLRINESCLSGILYRVEVIDH